MPTELPMQLPMANLPLVLRFRKPLTKRQLQIFCERQEVLHVERESDGSLTVRPIWGTTAGCVSTEVNCQLGNWADREGRGVVLSTVGCFLPDGSMRGPRLAFVRAERWNSLASKNGFLPFSPDFVIEIASHNYDRKELERRMEMWLANGTQLAWLIDPERKAVEIYRPGKPVEVQGGHTAVYGEDPVGGFVLELARIWR